MPQVIEKLDVATVGAAPEQRAVLRPGIVFLPCARCRKAVDMSLVGQAGLPLCERHRSS
jgi:hypothetical protein